MTKLAVSEARGFALIGVMNESIPVSFNRARNVRLFEDICEQIRRQVASGAIKPGDKLPPERELSEQFGASRTAVREALRSLEVSGLIELRKGARGGSFFRAESAPLAQSLEDMLDLGRISMADFTEARILMTEVVVRLACERGNKKDFDAIGADIDRLEAAIARKAGYDRIEYITNFYDLLAAATGNQTLRFLTHAIADILSKLVAAHQPSPMADLVTRRREILKSLRARNHKGAGRLLSDHLQRVHARMENGAPQDRPVRGSKKQPAGGKA